MCVSICGWVGVQEVRRLSRDQFMCLAHVNKIYRQQQAQWLAERPSIGAGGAAGGQQVYK